MSVQNMWLMCTKLNIGSYWSSPKIIDSIHEFTNLNKGEKCLGIFYMGNYDKEINTRIPRPIEDKVIWVD
jgi:nitroreductase